MVIRHNRSEEQEIVAQIEHSSPLSITPFGLIYKAKLRGTSVIVKLRKCRSSIWREVCGHCEASSAGVTTPDILLVSLDKTFFVMSELIGNSPSNAIEIVPELVCLHSKRTKQFPDRIMSPDCLPPTNADLCCYSTYFVQRFTRVLEYHLCRVKNDNRNDDCILEQIQKSINRILSYITDESQLLTNVKYAMLHGDISCSNALRDSSGLVYLLDWERWHIGDPALDIAHLSVGERASWENTIELVSMYCRKSDSKDGTFPLRVFYYRPALFLVKALLRFYSLPMAGFETYHPPYGMGLLSKAEKSLVRRF